MIYSTNFTVNNPQRFDFANFKGADFSSSPLEVDRSRASDMCNFINDDSINRKRYGYNEILRFPEQADGNPVNGIWNFTDETGSGHTLVHCGKKFYHITGLGELKNSFDNGYTEVPMYGVDASKIDAESRSYAAVQGLLKDGARSVRLFIFCGDYLMLVRRDSVWRMERVYDNPDTTIPVTSISIDPKGAPENHSATFQPINMLCSKRINRMRAPTEKELTYTDDNNQTVDRYPNGLSYQLDAEYLSPCGIEVEVEVSLPEHNGTTIKYYRNKQESGIYSALLYECDINGNFTDKLAGEMTWGDEKRRQPAVLHLPIDSVKPFIPDDTEDRITVTYTKAFEKGEERICGCKFGAQFGVSGNSDRLFVTGNPAYQNVDFYSEMNDFTYFGDRNTAVVGSDTVPITGYSRIGDGTLAIHKAANNQESTIYYRTSAMDNGQAIFPITSGAIGEGCVSPWANGNLSGDSLMLSENGVYGIVLASNVSTNERYARERSKHVNERLIKQNLADAAAVIYKNRYYLSVDGACYIADARFKSRGQTDMADTFNYEWWYWDSIDARVWAVIGNQLYFGTNRGQVCKFDNVAFSDRTYIRIGNGELMADMPNNRFVISSKYAYEIAHLSHHDSVSIQDETAIYEVFLSPGEITGIQDGIISVSTVTILKIMDGREVYADMAAGSGLSVNTAYQIQNTDYGNCTFEVWKDGAKVSVTDKFRLCERLDIEEQMAGERPKPRELSIINVDRNTFQVKAKNRNEPATIADYNNSAPSALVGSFNFKKPVEARWCTGIYDLGTNVYSKNLVALIITPEPYVSGEVEFGYKTRKLERYFNAQGVKLFDLSDMDFTNFTFETTTFPKSHTRKIKEKNVNYVMFVFRSTNDRNCAVNNLAVMFTLGRKNKGVQ